MPAFSFSSQTPMACGFAQLVRVKDSGPFPLRSTPSVDVVDDPYGIAPQDGAKVHDRVRHLRSGIRPRLFNSLLTFLHFVVPCN
jgi:hypothetical protein